MTLEQFIQEEMEKRKMSMREFSAYIGVSHSTISTFLNKPGTRNVSIDFMLKLSEKTNTDLYSIVAMVYPDHTGINAEARILAERITQLSSEQYKMIEMLLRGFSINVSEHITEDTDLSE